MQLSETKVYGRQISDFLLPDQIEIIQKQLDAPKGDAVDMVLYTNWITDNWVAIKPDLWIRKDDHRDQRTNEALVKEYQLFKNKK